MSILGKIRRWVYGDQVILGDPAGSRPLPSPERSGQDLVREMRKDDALDLSSRQEEASLGPDLHQPILQPMLRIILNWKCDCDWLERAGLDPTKRWACLKEGERWVCYEMGDLRGCWMGRGAATCWGKLLSFGLIETPLKEAFTICQGHRDAFVSTFGEAVREINVPAE